MLGFHWAYNVHISGQLSADAQGCIYCPEGMTLYCVAGTNSTAGVPQLKIGTTSGGNDILAYTNMGASGTPVALIQSNTASPFTLPLYHVSAGGHIFWFLDYDANGTVTDLDLLFDFIEG